MRSFFRDQPRRHGRAARVLAIIFLALPLVSRSAEAEVPAPARSPEDSLKAFESRARRLAAEGLPQKTREERQKESTPIIPEDCTIEVVSWHPADPQKQTETAVYEVRGGVVTARLPNLKVPETKSESSRREGYEITRSFEGRLQGNTIVGTWVFEHSYQEWGWTNRGVTSHNIVKTVDTMPTRIELHRDGTITWEMSFEHVTRINRLIGEPPGLELKRHSGTPDAWQQPGQGLWRFRPSSSTVVPAEGVPDEPTSSPSNLRPSASRFATEDPPGKFRLPPEKPSTRPLLTPKGQPSPTEEEELDDMPPFARRMFEALPAEKKAFFKKYHYNYGLGWQRSGNLLVWLSDTRLPMEELEVRAQLLLVTDHRYQQFYKTMVSTAIGSAVDGAMWKLAAQALPATRYAELVKELATTPYELSTIAAEYREAADADRGWQSLSPPTARARRT